MRSRLFALLVVPTMAMIVLATLLVTSANADYQAARDATAVARLADHIAELEQALAFEALAATFLEDGAGVASPLAGGDEAPGDAAGGSGRLPEGRAGAPQRLQNFWAAAAVTDEKLVAFERYVESLPDEQYGVGVAQAIRATLAHRPEIVDGLISQLQTLDRYARIRSLLIDTLSPRAASLGSVNDQDQIRVLLALIETRSAHLNERVIVNLAVQFDRWAPGQHAAAIESIAFQRDRLDFVTRVTGREGPETSASLQRWRDHVTAFETLPELSSDSWSRASNLWLSELTDIIAEQRVRTLESTLAAERSATNARTFTLVGVVVTLIVALALTAAVGFRLVRRMSIIKVQAHYLAAGLEVEPAYPRVGGRDELADLAKVFDDMAEVVEARTRNQWIESSALEAIAQGEPIDEIYERAALLLGTDEDDRPRYWFTRTIDPHLVPAGDAPNPDPERPEYRTAIGLVAMARQRDAQHRELEWQANRDELTGLLNRAAVLGRATKDLRPGGALVYIDLDRFKEINDAFGHHAGDLVLIEQSRRMVAVVEAAGGVTGRLGGDEFLAMLPVVEGDRALKQFCERLVGELSEPVRSENGMLEIGASVGAVISRPGVPAQKLLAEADAALYEAKRRGRGAAVLSDRQLRDQAIEVEQLRRDVLDGLERGEFVPWYQPIWSDGGRTLVGVEALTRWHHPERGVLSPGTFLPVLDELNLYPTFDAAIFEKVCRQVTAWLDRGLSIELVNYNLSTEFLEEHDFMDRLRSILEATGCPPELIVAEVTESGLMTDIESSGFRLQLLRAMGVRIAVDDFGQGNSSLAYLSDLPVDLLKIDRQFVDRIERKPTNQAIVAAVVTLGRSLGLDIVAEGVERLEELEHMIDIGCDLFQGFLLGRPEPAEEITALLGRGRPIVGSESADFFPPLDRLEARTGDRAER